MASDSIQLMGSLLDIGCLDTPLVGFRLQAAGLRTLYG
jgi:hypothetical protein